MSTVTIGWPRMTPACRIPQSVVHALMACLGCLDVGLPRGFQLASETPARRQSSKQPDKQGRGAGGGHMDLCGKVAVIAGGKRIGRVVAQQLAQRGMDVVLSYRGSKDEAQQTA